MSLEELHRFEPFNWTSVSLRTKFHDPGSPLQVGLHEEGQWSHGTGTTIHDGRVADGLVPNSAAVNRLVEALCRSVW